MLLFFWVNLALAQEHSGHSTQTKKSERSNQAIKKFNATEDLVVRMEKISTLLKILEKKKRGPNVIKEYGGEITGVVNDIFKVCKLEPEADAAVHPILGLILDGAADFKKVEYASGRQKIQKAFIDYEKRFSHEGWNP